MLANNKRCFPVYELFFFAMVVILIIHFMIQHYLLYMIPQTTLGRARVGRQQQRSVRFSEEIQVLGNSDRDSTEKATRPVTVNAEPKEIDLKSELLNYVQQYQETAQPDDSTVDGNDSEMEEYDELSQFFALANNDKYVFQETPTSEDDLGMDALPLETDKFSKDALETTDCANEKALSKNQWSYSNERVMNGANMFGGVTGFDSYNMGENFAMVSDKKA